MEVQSDVVPSHTQPGPFVAENNATSAALSSACVTALAVGAFAASADTTRRNELALRVVAEEEEEEEKEPQPRRVVLGQIVLQAAAV